jgi:hypothetical protein
MRWELNYIIYPLREDGFVAGRGGFFLLVLSKHAVMYKHATKAAIEVTRSVV